MHHPRPRRHADPPGTTSRQRRRGVYPPGPIDGNEILISTQFLRRVHDARGPFGRVSVFVHIGAEGGDPRKAKVVGGDDVDVDVVVGSRRHVVQSPVGLQSFDERENHPAETAIGMKSHAAFSGQFGQFSDGVDDPVGKIGRRSRHEDGVPRHVPSDVVHVHETGAFVDVHEDQTHAEIMSRLLERRVDGGRSDDFGGDDAAQVASAVSVGFAGEEDGFGASGGEGAAAAAVVVVAARAPAKEMDHHGDHLSFRLPHVGEQIRMERIRDGEQTVRLAEEFVKFLVSVINRPAGPSALP
mmetsp:Transcript_30742/g.61306  ORF Transcript_30742/g.61306 Transcript_30742/m.61306 type:complete len:298 (+) Transcript_30742:625-1518(+)